LLEEKSFKIKIKKGAVAEGKSFDDSPKLVATCSLAAFIHL
jgi:hypothetical protein